MMRCGYLLTCPDFNEELNITRLELINKLLITVRIKNRPDYTFDPNWELVILQDWVPSCYSDHNDM